MVTPKFGIDVHFLFEAQLGETETNLVSLSNYKQSRGFVWLVSQIRIEANEKILHAVITK